MLAAVEEGRLDQVDQMDLQRTLIYTSASDFQTTDYSAQTGLSLAKASSMYYIGHYRWYGQNGGTGGNPSESTAGTGTGIKVAVNVSCINHPAIE